MAMIMFSMLAICAHVVMRYIFNYPLNWTIDVSSILLLYATFLGAAWLLRDEGHVSVDVVNSFLKQRHQYLLQVVNSAICALVCAIITFYGVIETVSVWKLDLIVDMPLEPPKWVAIIIIPFGSILLFIQFLRRIRSFVRKLSDSENEKTSK
ncbi:TRAP transporter small permease [Thermodesulfobacteriota bacterium]